MATIVNNTYENNGKTYDAHTGQEVSTGLNPTGDQLAQRTSDAAAAEQPVPSPISRTIVDQATGAPSGPDAAQSYLDKFTPPKTADQLAEEKRKQSQGLIDSINNDYNTQIAQAKDSGQKRV